MRVKAAHLLKPSFGSYTATLLLHSFGEGKSQQRPRFKVRRNSLGGVAKNVQPSLFHHNFLLCSRHFGKCFIHCTARKPLNHTAG